MIVIGIEIDKKRAICYTLEKDNTGNIIDLTGKFKYIEIKDDHNNIEIRNFLVEIQSLFDSIQPNHISIIKRQTKGHFAASSISFKLEGLIQSYEKVNIEFISKPTLAAFYKKNPFTINCPNNYQLNAAQLANYILNK